MGSMTAWVKVSKDLQNLDADTLRGRAGSIPALLKATTLLLVRRGSEPTVQYLHGDLEAIRKAGELSGFRVTPLEDGESPELPETATHLRHALVPWRARLNGASNMERLRTDMHQVRRSIETIIPEDSYLAVTFRERSFFENLRIRGWVADEGNSVEDESALVRSGALLARMCVGCGGGAEARSVVENAARAVFSDISDMSSHRSAPRLGLPLVLLVLLVVSVAGVVWLPWCPVWLPLVLLVLLAAGVWRWWARDRWDDVFQVPRHYWRWWARRRRANGADHETPLGIKDRSRRVAGYPVQRTTLILDPLGVMSLCMPVGTAQAVSQDPHPVPEVLSRGGIFLGRDETGRAAYVDVGQLYGGVAIMGEPGSGKSALTHGIMQWAELHRGDTPARVWGEDSRIISFDMKDDEGVAVMRRYEEAHGLAGTKVAYLADPSSVGLDFLGISAGLGARDTAVDAARNMQYSFDDGDIRGNSLEVLTRALTIGVACERHRGRVRGGAEEIVERVRGLERVYHGAAKAGVPASAIGWALMAVGARSGGTGSARALGQVCAALSSETGDGDWVDAAEAAESLYGRPKAGSATGTTVSDHDFTMNVNSSMNKLTQLAADEHVFTARRARITWDWILRHPGNYHIVAAPHDGHRLSERMDRILGAWMLRSLWTAISTRCQGWRDLGRHTMILCDEASLWATADARIPAGLREQGRSLGVIPVQATQYPGQLPQELLTSITGYSTFAAFSIPDPDMADLVARRFGSSAGWTGETVSNLPKHQAAVRTRTDEQAQPAFTVRVHDFDHDFDESARQ